MRATNPYRSLPFNRRQRNPDTPNLSNDNVFTPTEFAKKMLDTPKLGRRSDHSLARGREVRADELKDTPLGRQPNKELSLSAR